MVLIKTDISSGRIGFFKDEFELFLDNPLFGVGVGGSKYFREKTSNHKGSSHNEITRMFSEHGIIGVFLLLFLIIHPLKIIYKNRRYNEFSFSLAFYLLWFLTINHSAMRLAFPSIVYGLSLINFKKNEYIIYIGNDLASKTNYNTSMNNLSNHLSISGLSVFRGSSKSNKVIRLFDMLRMVFVYRKKVSFVLIDTFSTSNFYYALLTSQLARLLKLKYIPILRGGNLPMRLVNNKTICNLIFNHSHVNVAPSNYLKTEFELYGYSTMFIPNILEIEKYKFKNRNSFQPKLLWVRAFDKIYNPTLAIKVLKLLKQQYTDSELTMVGPFKDDTIEKVTKLIDTLNLKDSV